MIIMTTTAAGYGEHQAGGGRGEEGRFQRSTTTAGGPPSIAAATAAAAKDDAAAALDSTKIRKPYTITKQRERWTDEEHQKFLEALKLYGRAWRQIEEHIGTKTAVQIRSHAQKFFSKVERDHQIAAAATAGGGGIGKGGLVVVPEGLIDIPPPRPKRKPSHPYPRKARGNAAAASKHSEDDTPPVVSPLSAVLVTEKPKNGFWETTTTRQEDDDDDGGGDDDDDDDATEEVLEERSSPNDALLPKDSISEEDKQLPAAIAPPPPPVQQVLSEPSWVPFPAFHAFPPQWGNSSFWNQLPNAPNHQHPACQNWAQFVGGSMPREHKPSWYHPSQMAYNSAAAMAAAALWPAGVSGTSSTITPVPNFSEFNGSQSLFKGITGSENEDGVSKATVAAAAASAATIAAASAWWAFTQSLASPLSFAAMGALYNLFMATMPSPLLFPQGEWLQQTKLQNPEPAAGEEEEEEEEDTPQVQTLEEPTSKELLCSSSSGHHGLVRSSAAHRAAERAIWVQEVKARRGMMMAMGSSSAGSSDICASSSQGGSCSKPESGDGGSKGSGQKLELVKKNHNHSGERKCTSPSSAGSSPPTQLHKLKSQLSGLVQKELSSAHARRSGDEQQREDEVGFENWKQLQDETFSGFSMDCHPVTSQCLLPALQFVKSGDLSGSNSFPTKCSNENPTEKSSSEEEHHHPPAVQTPSGSEEECGSDGGILTAENNTSAEEDSGGGGGGPSSNSSACGNLPEGNDRSGSSDGSSDVEATPNVPSSCKEENEAKIVETVTEEEAAQVSSRCFSDDGFTPFRKDNEKHVHEGCAVRHLLSRSLSLEAEQQKEEAMGRHQIAFQVLFARETLPRTFSPPPRGDSLEACRAPNSDSLEALQAPTKSLSPHLRSRISSSHSKASSFVSLPAADEDHHPRTTAYVADQHDNSAFNAWQSSKASKPTTAEIERCESCSIITTSSGAPQVTTKGTETQWCPKRTRDTKRRERYGEGGATFDWLTLRTESSRIPEQVKDDSVDLHFNLHQEESLHQQQSLTHNIDLFPRLKKEKFAVASSSKLDDTRSSSAFSEIISSEPFLSGSSSNTHSSVSFLMAAAAPSSSSSGTAAALSTVSSNLSVKYSGVGFVPYQRVPSSEP